MTSGVRVPRRPLHPAAWWLWAVGLATAAIETTNPIVLLLIGTVVVYVVAVRRDSSPWSRSLVVFLRLGLFVILLRVVLQAVFGDRIAGHTLFVLPHVGLPAWAAGVSVGGPVTAEAVLTALSQGLRLAVVLVAFGAANSLASPYRLLRCLPAVLYETGVAVTVAMTYAPELVMTITDVRAARRLRGRPVRGFAGLRGMAVPVLEGALDRSLELASSMDARGFGRTVVVSAARRRRAGAATAAGGLLLLAGLYTVLDASSPWGVGVGALLGGTALLAVGVVRGGRRAHRTRYRPDPWSGAEWAVALSGAAIVATFSLANALGIAGLQATFYPLQVPPVPLLPLLGVLAGLVPAMVAPAPRRAVPVSAEHGEAAPVVAVSSAGRP